MEKGQGTDNGERLATSHPKEIRYREGTGDRKSGEAGS
jgi:hypothetical protein